MRVECSNACPRASTTRERPWMRAFASRQRASFCAMYCSRRSSSIAEDHHIPRAESSLRALHTTPGTLADDLGCLAALISLAAVAYILLVLS